MSMHIDKAKEYLRLCNAARNARGTNKWASELWHGYACDLCGGCCPECTTPWVIKTFFKELDNYEEEATKEEYLSSKLVSKWQKEEFDKDSFIGLGR